MSRFVLIPLIALTICLNAGAAEEPDAPTRADEAALQALPKVPTMATIVGDGVPKAQVSKYVQELIKKKETKARVEIVLLKQKLIAEQETTDVAEKERIRRKILYDKAHGTLFDTQPVTEKKRKTIRMKLEFQVPEIEVYTRLVNLYKSRAALAADVVDALTKLDRDNDGKLTADEYRDAAHIFLATQRLFLTIDSDNDGQITIAEIDAAKAMPASASAALAEGAVSKEAAGGPVIIAGFDADKDGVLTIAERKALSSAYLEAELKAQQEADAYQRLLDELITSRQVTAAKFENLTIDMLETK